MATHKSITKSKLLCLALAIICLRVPLMDDPTNGRLEEVIQVIIKGDIPYYFPHLRAYLSTLHRRSL